METLEDSTKHAGFKGNDYIEVVPSMLICVYCTFGYVFAPIAVENLLDACLVQQCPEEENEVERREEAHTVTALMTLM